MEYASWLKEETDETSGDVFDVFAVRYDNWYDKPFGRSAFNLEKDCVDSLCENTLSPSLEVGVGTGRFAAAFKIECGVDRSAGVLKFAKERGITVVKGVGERLPFVDECFHTIFIIVTLCFVDEPLKVLKEASRVLKNDGSVVLGLILKESPWAIFYKKKGEVGNIFYKTARFYSLKELEAMVKKAGLRIIDVYSTIFQNPTEKPLRSESPKKGYYKNAGFVTMKAAKLK